MSAKIAPAPMPMPVGRAPQAISDNRADSFTLFTKPGKTRSLVSLPQWSKVTFRLETAGPVVVGTREQLDPVGSGKGRLLSNTQDVVLTLGPNTRLYYCATGEHRVSVQIEALPWGQSIFESLQALLARK